MHQLSRQLHYQGGSQGNTQRQPRWAGAITATKSEHSNRLQPKFGHMVLSAGDRPLELLAVPSVAPAAELHAIQVDGKHLGELVEFCGRSGAACRAAPGRVRGVSRVVF